MQLAQTNENHSYFHKYKIHDEPECVVCEKIIIDPNNRDGQAPDVQYLHRNLEANQETDGWLDTRPKLGILVKLADPAKKQRAVAHNLKLVGGSEGLYPPLNESLVEYSSLGGTT